MRITKGEKGLSHSWQEDFPKTIKCHKCKGVCRIMFVAHESLSEDLKPESYICALHDNRGAGGYWPHDAIACAVYLCKDCFEPNAILNQA